MEQDVAIIEGCIGCGMCVTFCPQVFVLGEKGLAEVANQPTEDLLDAVEASMEYCPETVIVWQTTE